tara:strand:+ start:89 stop:244 length:156 start_codon:yes stop_codon:yes gene_type:complete
VVNKTAEQLDVGQAQVLPWWRFAFRLLRVAVMLVLAFWLSRNGDAFFYQGF